MASEAVYKYLLNTNRPYSANDITLNLHKEYGKTAVQKGLDELVESNRIREKVYGKQKVYCILQTDNADPYESNMSNLEEEIKSKLQILSDLQKELNNNETKLKELLSEPVTSEIGLENENLKEMNDKLKERLATLTSGKVSLISEEQRNKVKRDFETMLAQQRKRKRMATDILDSILEGYPKSKACLYEEIGIELDP